MKQKVKMGLFIFFLGILMTACGRNNENGNEVQNYNNNDNYGRHERPEDNYQRGSVVKIAKSDGSLQCRQNPGLSLTAMARRQLPGIQILSASKQYSGQTISAACGYDTGVLNVYEIYYEDLRIALDAGFLIFQS